MQHFLWMAAHLELKGGASIEPFVKLLLFSNTNEVNWNAGEA